MRHVEFNDFTMRFVDSGEGPVVLCVHGFPLDHTMWTPQVEALRNEYRMIVPDLRGFGGSGAVRDSWSMQQFSDDLASLLDAIDISERVTLCGLSMGGYIGWQFAKSHGHRLRALIACDTKATADPPEVARGRQMMADDVLAKGSQDVAEGMLPKLVAPTTFEQQVSLIESLRATIGATSPQAIAAAQRGMAARPDMTSFVRQIEVPTLIVCGEHDAITPPDVMQQLAADIPNAFYVEIENAGHLAPLENPSVVNQHLSEFLRSV